MSQYSAPCHISRKSPLPAPVNRGRSYTYQSNSDAVPLNKAIYSSHYKDANIYNTANMLKRQQSQQIYQKSRMESFSSDPKSPLQEKTPNYSVSSESGNNEKWKKLKCMIEQVNNMKQIADMLFSSVKIQPINEPTNYSGYNEYEYQVELLRNVIDEQIARMKAYWCGEESITTNTSQDQQQIEQMRYNTRDMFNRMKTIVEDLCPPDTSKPKYWIEDLKSQLTNLEVSIRGYVKSRSCDYSQSKMNSPLPEPDSYSALRIKELESELEASLKREDDLRLKLKLFEERKEKEIKNMDDEMEKLQQILNRANARANKSSDEAYNLNFKLLEIEANMKQRELELSEQTYRRGGSRVGYMRTSPEYVNKQTVEVIEGNGDFVMKRSPLLRTENIYAQPKPIPGNSLRKMSSPRQFRTSVTSQGSRVVSPKEKKNTNLWRENSFPDPRHRYTSGGNEYTQVGPHNRQPQYLIETM